MKEILKRITPACAGSMQKKHDLKADLWDHPRLRGEHFIEIDNRKGTWGITPACAGSMFSG